MVEGRKQRHVILIVVAQGSFIGQFLRIWNHKLSKGEVDPIEEGDVFITNDTYEVEGAVSHLNDVIVLLPIYFEHKLIGWAANFGHSQFPTISHPSLGYLLTLRQ
jgi:5-oxoprolinase (ATP-hydrolysing)